MSRGPVFTPAPQRRPSKRSIWPVGVAVIVAGGSGFVGGWYARGASDAKTGVPVAQARKLPAEAKSIVQWLAENLDDPDWQLVKFWKPREMKEARAERIAELEEFVSKQEKILRDNPTIFDQFRQSELQQGRDLLAQTKDRAPELVARLRYRAKSGGELKLRDEFFVIGKNGSAERSSNPHVYKRHFPDE